ncbi:hypothetical protein NP534_17415 [Pseudomonas sp. 39004]|uniref:hypothetical protein n=1 Tax=Pseudomonas sp. 39004 TaxID=2967213 RepID=UPI002363A186|nr:hypothetical protein [Pseudomonas sp. 39004]MDD1961892.1 hypothetical protein [Pseudomonas sp. 39004]
MSNEKIKINGVPPKWSDDEYEQRMDRELHAYRHTAQSREMIRKDLPHQFLEIVAEKVGLGYQVCNKYPVTFESLNYNCYLIKPTSMQEEDIVAIRTKVKEEYTEWLRSEHTRYQDLLRQQLIQTQKEKEAKALREKEAKQLAEIEKQVQACYTPLEIPE